MTASRPRAALISLFSAVLMTLPVSIGHAHELSGSTATVVLRDGLVRVDANLDIRAWLSTQPRGELTAMLATARTQAATLVVRIDGRPMPMTLVKFPTAEQVHRVLQSPETKGHSHGPRVVPVRWQATRSVPNAHAVSVQFPPAIGRVLVSFVEPRSQIAEPGAAVGFKSSRPQPPKPR